MAKQIEYPADTVDSRGKVWDTIGENIRNGAKDKIVEEITDFILNGLYPIGSTYVGELPKLLKNKFEWKSGTRYSTKNLGTILYGVGSLTQTIAISSNYTIPILTNDDVVTFKEKTGIELQQGCYLIPVYTRVA